MFTSVGFTGKEALVMFGIILGTLCLIALVATIRREHYYRRHGYPQHGHGHCGHRGCHGHHGHHGYGGPPAPPAPPAPDAAQPGSAS